MWEIPQHSKQEIAYINDTMKRPIRYRGEWGSYFPGQTSLKHTNGREPDAPEEATLFQ